MMVSADARYQKRVYLRADQDFTDKVQRIRSTHALKSSSSAIRYAVDYTVACDIENEKKAMEASDVGKKDETGNYPDGKIPAKSSKWCDIDSRSVTGTNACADAEAVRRVSVEIEALAQDGRQRGYLSEEQVKLLLAYHRELSRSLRKLAGADG